MILDFTPAVEHALETAFKARGIDRLDSWYLFEMVVDPNHQGKGQYVPLTAAFTNPVETGYTSLLMDAGFRRTTPKPVHLEATKASTRDIYAHYGFEVSIPDISVTLANRNIR